MLIPFLPLALYFYLTTSFQRVEAHSVDHVRSRHRESHLAHRRRGLTKQLLLDTDDILSDVGITTGDETDYSEFEDSSTKDQKYVFMHHIVGNTYAYTNDSWLSDFQIIEGMGIDAVALNIGPDSWQFDQITAAYNAALQTPNLKLFLSFDYTAFPCDVATTVKYVNNFKSHPSQFNVNGKPMISSYSGFCLGATGWQKVRDQSSGYLMPFIYGEPRDEDLRDEDLRLGNSFGFFDAWYCWGCAWPQGNHSKTTDDDHYYMDILGDRFATTISGWFYTHYSYKSFYLKGDDWLLNTRWEQLFAMRDTLTFVEMVTWNDFGESDYFGPLTSGQQPDGTTWANGFPHIAWLDMSKYYITAFKTGAWPKITEDAVYFWCRPHLANATATNDALSRPVGWDWSTDYLWAAVFCTSICHVELSVGNYRQMFPQLGRGVSKIKLPLNDVGPVVIRMYKSFVAGSGVVTVIEHNTQGQFEVTSSTEKYNYNVYVGKATAASDLHDTV